ncbi:MAG: hypothetical protein ACI9WC_002832 [Arenicella sp.]|jgi:hypothetical protein
MSKQARHSELDDSENDFSDFVDSLNFDNDNFLDHYEKPSHKRSKRSKEARRRIEQFWEDRELENRLDEYYYHTDD